MSRSRSRDVDYRSSRYDSYRGDRRPQSEKDRDEERRRERERDIGGGRDRERDRHNRYRNGRSRERYSNVYDRESRSPPRHRATDIRERSKDRSREGNDENRLSTNSEAIHKEITDSHSREFTALTSRASPASTLYAGQQRVSSSAKAGNSQPLTSSKELSAEEKRKIRLERLEEWKKKKELESQGILKESTDINGSTSDSNVLGSSKSVRNSLGELFDELMKAETNVACVGSNQVSLFGFAGSAKVEKSLSGNAKPRSSLLDDEVKKALPKLPNASIYSSSSVENVDGTTEDYDVEMKDGASNDEEEDPLDAFMSTIEQTNDSGNSAALPSLVMNAEEEEENQKNDENSSGANPEDLMASIEKRKRKDVPIVDHSKIQYEPFRKNFYVEPQEMANMTEAEADQLRLELDGIKVRGTKCPKPAMKWPQFGIPAPTMEVIRDLGYEKPTAIQCQAVPAIMSGRDVIGVAKTGSGKTMAFLLPLFRHIKDQRPLESLEGPMALIMTPTRELAVQIYRECRPFTKALNLRAVCAYGGSPIKEQIADLKRGAEIIVCTPGRMIDLLAANSGRVTNLRRVTYIVLDEADRMFDMGFEPQVMKIINNIRPDRQTVLFSATFPRQMEALARKILTKPVEIVVGARSVVAEEVTQIVEVREEQTKFLRVLELLGEFYHRNGSDTRVLIFVDRQESADNLLKELMSRGYPCMSIHGGKDQVDRDSTIADFKNGVVSLLVATSVAARGLDVKQLKLVINYDCPNHMEDYVHRVGRTGRAGNTGTAVTFITPEQDRSAADIAKALRLSKQVVPEEVQKLADKFSAKVKEGSERFGSGFGGKGLEKLDEARDLERKRERKAFGEEEAEEIVVASDDEGPTTVAGGTPAPTDKIGAGQASAIDRLRANGRVIAGPAPDNRGLDSAAFHAVLEFNDFPQQARWAVTNNANQQKVSEANTVSITTKGAYYAPGKQPGEGDERKLYLLIEGPTDISVGNAYKELVSLLVSGIESAAQHDRRAPVSGRYKVT